jgi:hypothetical protein
MVKWFGPRARLFSATLAGYIALTIVVTWPQVRFLSTYAADHHDVYFNMWRLSWFAHALATKPGSLFDGNTFYPEPRTLTFSDAMPVEGLTAAPLLWAHVPPVLVHNLLLLGAMVGSALAMFVLARRLTGSAGAAFVAGAVFALAPYRFAHYAHMELQWTVWTPLAFWAVHRTIDSGRWKDGLLAGAFVALQMLSSVYYGIFLGIVLTLATMLLLLGVDWRRSLRAVRALALGGVLAAIVSGAYAMPYLSTKREVGERPLNEISRFSARPRDYLRATPRNWLYGRLRDESLGDERTLFPGALPVLLAIVGLLLLTPSRAALVYVVTLAAAFEMSLGLKGYVYSFLHEHLQALAGLRAPARFGVFVLMALAVLAAYGHAAVIRVVPAARRLLPVVACAILLIEYRVSPLALTRYDNSPPDVYVTLAAQPRGLVAEFPTPLPNALPGNEPYYTYMSTFHWMPLFNGYSGFYPNSYLMRLGALVRFPDDRSIETLKRLGVSYIVVHPSFYEKPTEILLATEARPELHYLAHLRDGVGMAVLYRLR